MADWTAAFFIFAGLLFFFVGSVGLLRLPDLHSRLHALTKVDNLGLGFTTAGLAILDGSVVTSIKLLLIWLLVMAASAASAYLIAQHALKKENG